MQKNKKANDDIQKFEAATEAYRCLKSAQCRNEYTRFGQSVSMSSDIEGFIEYDWRIGFSPCFFIMFAFIHGALGSVEQKPGLRLSMGLGIVFCMTEVRLLSDVASQIE